MGEPRFDEGYANAVRLVAKLIEQWLATHEAPKFRFPGVPMIADLRDIGKQLALNDSARELVAHLNKRLIERTGHAPTLMQLKATLEVFGVATETCSMGALGLNVGQA